LLCHQETPSVSVNPLAAVRRLPEQTAETNPGGEHPDTWIAVHVGEFRPLLER